MRTHLLEPVVHPNFIIFILVRTFELDCIWFEEASGFSSCNFRFLLFFLLSRHFYFISLSLERRRY